MGWFTNLLHPISSNPQMKKKPWKNTKTLPLKNINKAKKSQKQELKKDKKNTIPLLYCSCEL